MNLTISSFANNGDIGKERLILKANVDLDIGKYAVLYTELTADHNATAGSKLAYWFPDEEIKANDLVVLYSKNGTSSKKDLGNGRTAHFFYWERESPLWNDKSKGAVVLQVAGWAKKAPGE